MIKKNFNNENYIRSTYQYPNTIQSILQNIRAGEKKIIIKKINKSGKRELLRSFRNELKHGERQSELGKELQIFRANELTGSKNLLAIEIEVEDNLERCIGVLIIIYSPLDGFTQVLTRSSVEDSSEIGK